MQIILLSGGSGKRLWPLSNGTRAKQFLQLLPSPDGTLESMVQRVVRELTEQGLGENINFATSLAQKDQLCNQVKGNIHFITEPDHRGTLPAISLSALYLNEHKNCDRNEIVLVMPCDSFVSEEYYTALKRAIKVAEEGNQKTFGWILSSNVTKRKVINIIDKSKTSSKEIALAGKGFSQGKVNSGNVDYDALNTIENFSTNLQSDKLKNFIKEGNLKGE